jgi:transposase-like protein
MPDTHPKTLLEAVQHFADQDVCHQYMIALKWPDGRITCSKCGGDRISNITTRRVLKCLNKECHKQFSAKVGTIFEDSPLPLGHWFTAVWCIANFKVGISSHELGRTLGVTQKTAWFMLHRIRLAMQPTSGDGKAFDDLARKLVQVPKKELDSAEKRYQRRKARKEWATERYKQQ